MTTPADPLPPGHPTIDYASEARADLPTPIQGPQSLGRFEVRRYVGEGAFGRVYEAYDPSLKRVVALKVAKAERLEGEKALDRFHREARAAANLLHPNIVAVFDHGDDAGRHYIASAFLPGRPLDEVLQKSKSTIPLREAVTIARRLAEALAYAHTKGVVHRDVKPANVMLTETGEPLLMDFGLAARLDEQDKLTQDGAILGTYAYMAPEQWRNQATAASDQYSLGCVLFELLTGQTPFGGGAVDHWMYLHLHQAPTSPRSLRPEVPLDLETICLKCLEKEPQRRYPDCQALADDLRRWLDGEPVSARRPGPGERLAKWARRNPALAATTAGLVLLTALGGSLLTWQWLKAEAALATADRARRDRAFGQAAALRDASPGAVPGLLGDLAANRDEVLPRLRELFDQEKRHDKRMRLALALLPAEPETVRDELIQWMLRADDPAEVLLAREALRPHAEALRPRLWAVTAPPAERFRALVGLAEFDPRGEGWARAAPEALQEMLTANPLHLGAWVEALRPVRAKLIAPLAEVFRGKRLAEQKQVAALVLARYVESAATAADLLLDADGKQYAALRPLVRGQKVVELLRCEVHRQPVRTWNDAPLPAAWGAVPAGLRAEVERHGGRVEERFAFAVKAPAGRVPPLAEAMHKHGYRLARLRPAADTFALLWARDGAEQRLVLDASRDDLLKRDAELQKDGFRPEDVVTLPGGRCAGVWRRAPKEPARKIQLGLAARAKEGAPLAKTKHAPLTLHSVATPRGTLQSGVWAPSPLVLNEGWNEGWNLTESNFTAWCLDMAAADVSACARIDEPVQLAGEILGWLAGPWTGLAAAVGRKPALDRRYSYGGVWELRPEVESRTLLGTAEFASLLAGGWRMVALDAAGEKVASAWRRPAVPLAERERLDRRRAVAAATLLQLGTDDAWPLFRHTPDPTARSFLVEQAAVTGVEPGLLIDRLAVEKDVSARRALILALGDYDAKALPAERRGPLVKTLLAWYRDDPDPGIHGAIDWLLRHAKEGPLPRALDWGQRAELERIDQALSTRAGSVSDGQAKPVANASGSRARGAIAPPGPARRQAKPVANASGSRGPRGWFVNGQGQTFSVIRGPVEFVMGSPADEPDRVAINERQHVRVIPRGFALMTRAVTVADWERFVAERPEARVNFVKRYSPEPGGPIVGVDFYNAMKYCNWLSEKEGLPRDQWCYPEQIGEGMRPFPDHLRRVGYRLPTEAEWEFACKAGSISSRYYGQQLSLLPRYAFFQKSSDDRAWPAGQKRPNDLGLFDLHGNSYTWCQDMALLYRRGRVTDKEDIRDILDRNSRILRGGSFDARAPVVRSSIRFINRPSNRNVVFGLRVCRTYR